jgi:AcrR family transcriptional regulator
MATTPRLTRAEQQARTRAALLDAAARVFVERGFQGASVELITESAGFSRGAFYSNFTSKEQLFAELLQDRIYGHYRQMARTSAQAAVRPSLRDVGEHLAAIQANADGRWLFRLWLELLAHAGRDEEFRSLAADFWKETRELSAVAIEQAFADAGAPAPIPPRDLASAMIALDIGLALQHFVDPDGAPLELYPELYEALFSTYQP